MKKVIVNCSHSPSLVNFRGDLIKKLTEYGYDVVCIGPDDDTGLIERQLSKIGSEYIHIPLSRNGLSPINDIKYFLGLIKAFRKVKPSIVINYTVKPVVYGSLAAFLSRVPKRISLITGLGFSFSDSNERFSRKQLIKTLSKLLYRVGVYSSSHVLFQNPDDERKLLDGGYLPKNKSFVTNGSGVNLDVFHPKSMPKFNVIRFLMIGRLIKDKGVYDFVEAAKNLKSIYGDKVHFDLVGWSDGEEGSISKNEIDNWVSAGIISYHGKLDDVREIICRCHIFVLPSYYPEGTPRTILESMALGKAIITTDSVGCRETVIPGYNGYLVNVRSPNEIVKCAEDFIKHNHNILEMGNNSLELAKTKYDVNVVNTQIFQYCNIERIVGNETSI